MKIYIAHNFDARIWLREIINQYFQGHEITSRWIYDKEYKDFEDNANMDIDDIKKADCLVLFVDNFGAKRGKGKWFEFGLAFALDKQIVLFGKDRSCVFTNLNHKLIWNVGNNWDILKNVLRRIELAMVKLRTGDY